MLLFRPDGRLDTRYLFTAFQQFYRENSGIWLEIAQYREAGPQLLLMAFLQRVVNGGGRIEREYGLGRFSQAKSSGSLLNAKFCIIHLKKPFVIVFPRHIGTQTRAVQPNPTWSSSTGLRKNPGMRKFSAGRKYIPEQRFIR
ncbi:hypothetical protein [Methanospirillum sp.]